MLVVKSVGKLNQRGSNVIRSDRSNSKFQYIIGAELTDFVLVLNTKEAVKTFSQLGNITLGGNVSGK